MGDRFAEAPRVLAIALLAGAARPN